MCFLAEGVCGGAEYDGTKRVATCGELLIGNAHRWSMG
jgi:hypothetical protein